MTKLYHIRGTHPKECRAVQVDVSAASLNSNDVFVAIDGTHNCFVWEGAGASEEEKSLGKWVGGTLLQDAKLELGIQTVEEGAETDKFWETLGGKKEYASDKVLAEDVDFLPRLFQVLAIEHTLCSSYHGE